MKEKGLAGMLFDNLGVGEREIRGIIKKFSVYLEKYADEYYYNYKYLPSHLDDFCKANQSLCKFEQNCERFNVMLQQQPLFADLMEQIKICNERMEFKIVFNNSVQYKYHRETLSGKIEKSILDVPEKNSWLNKDSINIDIRMEFNYQEVHFVKNLYDVTEKYILVLINSFFNEVYKKLINNYLEESWLIKLKEAKVKLIYIEDSFICDLENYRGIDNLYEDGVIRFESRKDTTWRYNNKGILKRNYADVPVMISLSKNKNEVAKEIDILVKK